MRDILRRDDSEVLRSEKMFIVLNHPLGFSWGGRRRRWLETTRILASLSTEQCASLVRCLELLSIEADPLTEEADINTVYTKIFTSSLVSTVARDGGKVRIIYLILAGEKSACIIGE